MLSGFSAPIFVYLVVTNACNLRCIYCSASSGQPHSNELSLSEMYRLIDDLRNAMVFQATITGGEPFVRKDIFQIISRLRDSNIGVELISNGTTISKRIAQSLRDLNVRGIKISLDATSPEVNDATRGVRAFARAYRGIRTLLQHGIQPGVLVTVTRFNYNQVLQIAETLRALDVAYVAFNMLCAAGRGACTYSILSLSHDECVEFSGLLREAKAEYRDFVREDLLHWYSLPGRLGRFLSKAADAAKTPEAKMLPCGAAKTGCAILPDGSVVPCNKFIDYSCGNIRDQRFVEIWNGERMRTVRALSHKLTAEGAGCGSCGYNTVCSGGCRAEAYLHFSDIEAPDPACAVLPDSAVHQYSREPGRQDLSIQTVQLKSNISIARAG